MNLSARQSRGAPGGGAVAVWKRFVVGALVVAATAFLLSIPFLRFGAVVGEEFSPDVWRRQRYNYWEIPWVHYQVTPLKKQDETNDLETYLAQQKLAPPANQANPRWDLVTLRRAEIEAPPGDAAILCRYLDQKDDDGELRWLQWTKDRPQLAQVLWPAVADVARRELYIFVPELFHLAERAEQPGQLRRQVAAYLAERFQRLAEVQRQLGRPDGVAEWLQAARDYRAVADAPAGSEGALPQLERNDSRETNEAAPP